MSDFIFTCCNKGCHQLTDINGGYCDACWEEGFRKAQDDADERSDGTQYPHHAGYDAPLTIMELSALSFQEWS